MKYYGDMCSKWGFGDGDAVPEGVDAYRQVYVTAVNKIAESLGSEVRLQAFDRGGIHNSCMVITVAVGTDEEAEVDPAFEAAADLAQELRLDGWVEVKTVVDPGFEAYVEGSMMEEVKNLRSGG